MLNMTIIVNDFTDIPFTDWLYNLILTGQVHGIVSTRFLPILKFTWPSFIVNHLILGTGFIRTFILWIFYYVIHHTAVATCFQFPFPLKFEVRKLSICHYIATRVPLGSPYANQGTVFNDPVSNRAISFVVSMPTGKRFAIKETNPLPILISCFHAVCCGGLISRRTAIITR